jgi:hypothetical protein
VSPAWAYGGHIETQTGDIKMIRMIPVIALGIGLAITAMQAPSKIAHTVNTHTPGVVQW